MDVALWVVGIWLACGFGVYAVNAVFEAEGFKRWGIAMAVWLAPAGVIGAVVGYLDYRPEDAGLGALLEDAGFGALIGVGGWAVASFCLAFLLALFGSGPSGPAEKRNPPVF